jgi:RNA polymerase sigma-70 factor (ECF subfamily)
MAVPHDLRNVLDACTLPPVSWLPRTVGVDDRGAPKAAAAAVDLEDRGAVSLELETVRRAAEGDSRAQAWLARRVLARVRKVARALSRHAADADDAAQLSLIEILRSARTYRGESNIEAWAGRIAVRTTMRHLRREKRKTDAVVDTPALVAAVRPASALAETLPRDVRHYLDQLPEPQRDAIVLHHALGYSLDEIAEMEGVSPNTIKSRLRLGGAALKKLVRRDRKLGVRTGGLPS